MNFDGKDGDKFKVTKLMLSIFGVFEGKYRHFDYAV